MNSRNDLLVSVSETIQTYRQREVERATPDHVARWLSQFTPDTQIPFLREFDHVLKQTFITLEDIKTFLIGLSTNQKLAGTNPIEYWKNANFLKIQKKGQSQAEMLRIFGECLAEKGLDINNCGSEGGDFIYLDDALFSGGRVRADLTAWLRENAPAESTVHIVVAASHTGGEHYIQKRLQAVAAEVGKKVKLEIWRVWDLENRAYYKNESNILWPTAVPDDEDVRAYLAEPSDYPFSPRVALPQVCEPFSSEQGRQLLEAEFLIAGAKIWSACDDPNAILRPLGFSPFGVGFGSMIVTYRNCPNNCPLAMWWGDASARMGALHWYPLLPRTTYSQNALHDFEAIEA